MASTSASSVRKTFKYDVFLSFRGEDTRKNFVDHLYHALQQKGVTTYKDDERIGKGKRISDELIKAIEDSRFHIIIFSKNYASSSWCLDELVKIMECQKMTYHTAYPVFYDVDPTDVRNQSGGVGEAFAKQVEKKAASIWRDAMKGAASLAGWELKSTADGHEAKLVETIVKEISPKLHFIGLNIDENLVGMQTRVKSVVSSLEIDTNDVHIIGIKGMGGGGKTTLARAVFDHISVWFECKSFVENVREGSKGSGLKQLQKQILQDVLNDQSVDVKSIYDGKSMMKKIMPGRKVVVVLDDVDHIEQLEALAGNPNWFKPGSRIIITTRDEQVLIAHKVNFIHDVNLLSNQEAIRLFSRYAFGRESPIQGYEELSVKVVHYASGLPLTIKVLGSHLYGRNKCEWVDAIKRLEHIPLKETLEKLELSYNGLESDQKEIFLDVVCMLKGEKKDDAIKILESCGYHAQIGLRVLEQKSLITVSNIYHILGFHDHIEEMGKNIVRRFHPNDPSKHSRLWIKNEIEDILVNESGTNETRSMTLVYSDLHPETIIKGLRKMKELRFLRMTSEFGRWEVDKVSRYSQDALRYIYSHLTKTFQANKFVNLEKPWNTTSPLWKVRDQKVLDKLRYINLSGSNSRAFDTGVTPHLEMLVLERCRDFVKLHMPFECPKLKYLNLCGSKVSNLNLGMSPHLEELNLKDCYYLQNINAPVGCLKKLVCLYLCCSRFKEFLTTKRDSLLFMAKQREIPGHDSIPKLELVAKSRYTCPMHPNNSLPKLAFRCKYSEPLPSSNGNLEKLLSFGLCACTNIKSFSANISGLQNLRQLTLKGSIPEVPKDLGHVQSLEMLFILSMKDIKHLPDSICMLKHLKYLRLEDCLLLEQLPKDLGMLENLEVLDLIECISLRAIPKSICKMKCLKYLQLYLCFRVGKLPQELGCLIGLKRLNVEGTDISSLPQSIYQLKGLRIIGTMGQLQSFGFTSLTEFPEYTLSYYVEL